MKRRLAAAVAVLLAVASALPAMAAEPRPFLWLVEGETPSFLFGTIHLPDERVLALPGSVRDALAASDAVYTEIPLDVASQLQISASMLLPRGETLRQLLPEDVHRRAAAYLASRDRDMELFERFTIWSFIMQLSFLDELEIYMDAMPLDLQLYQDAAAAGKEVGGLETVAEQIEIMGGMSHAEQAELLSQTLDHLEELEREGGESSAAEKMVDLYLTGDLEAIRDEMAAQLGGEDPTTRKLSRRLLGDRNQRMAERIAAHLREHPGTSYFFAVGAAHMAGDDGVPALLAERGFTLHRLEAQVAVPAF